MDALSAGLSGAVHAEEAPGRGCEPGKPKSPTGVVGEKSCPTDGGWAGANKCRKAVRNQME